MSTTSKLIWVNKPPDSSSLSNCRSEKEKLRQIRSHAVIVGHRSSRAKRPIKRTPFDLKWSPRGALGSFPDTSSLQALGDNNLRFQRQQDYPSTSGHASSDISKSVPSLAPHLLSSRYNPFSHYSIPFDAKATLEHLWYFQHIWAQCAFKLPNCVGYGELPIPQVEIIGFIQQCLTCPTQAYCLLAATIARLQYIHHPTSSLSDMLRGQEVAHRYAAKAMQGLQRRMQDQKEWEEEEATEALFLAAYEVFSRDKVAGGNHLIAVRRLYKRDIENTFMRSLQAEPEILVAKSLDDNWHQAIDHLLQLR
ncbi:hypothetical protein V8E51_012735 [Hyaloscypha variabilis]